MADHEEGVVMAVEEIVAAIIEAHGGRDFWEKTETLDGEISASGFLFTAKRRPVLDHVRITSWCHEPRFAFHDFPAPGLTAELLGHDQVRIRDSRGLIIARRDNPRAWFRGRRHFFSWDDLDFTYFGGYATWNYLAMPFLLLREGVACELCDGELGQMTPGPVLRVTFPPDLPTHCRTQIFRFDAQFRLLSLEYTAEVVGGWAHALHRCRDYRDFDGLQAPSVRQVYPLLANRVLPGPLLVDLKIHEIRPMLPR
jgi:hypothetical protein